MDDTYTLTPASTLPNGWVWRDWDDGSGSLQSSDGTRYFLYDLSPYCASGGIEYLERPGTCEISWGVFYGSLTEFKSWAEPIVQKKYL